MLVLNQKLHKSLHKTKVYLINFVSSYLIPKGYFERKLRKIELKYSQLPLEEKKYIDERVNYYNKLSQKFNLINKTQISEFKKEGHSTSYFLDLSSLLKYFPKNNFFAYYFGDITEVPEEAGFVKSRPISDHNENSVLLKLNAIRHYYFYPDSKSFEEKKPELVWRGYAQQPHRIQFLEQFLDHPLCNVGCAKSKTKHFYREEMTLPEQMEYRYILCIEGNDVASNLKWAMYSNSLCFMTKPKYETWFMEGKLKAGVHYVELKEDYSDLEEKIHYYNEHISEAQQIIDNAHQYLAPFLNKKKERMINLLVMKKYFSLLNEK